MFFQDSLRLKEESNQTTEAKLGNAGVENNKLGLKHFAEVVTASQQRRGDNTMAEKLHPHSQDSFRSA